jgi:hypothetical protein
MKFFERCGISVLAGASIDVINAMSFDFNYRTNCAISRINFAMLAACGLLIACSPKIITQQI